jgi:geranylgeranyl transferase type-1 subunit beta
MDDRQYHDITIMFDRQRHLRYFSQSLRSLPAGYGKLDTNRLTLVHFCVHALDLLGVWDNEALQAQLHLDKTSIIEWIYALQVVIPTTTTTTTTTSPTTDDSDPSVEQQPEQEQYEGHAGFKGGSFLGGSFIYNIYNNNEQHHDDHLPEQPVPQQQQSPPWAFNHGHVAMTYTALCTLRALGDDLSRVDKRAIIQALKSLQQISSSSSSSSSGSGAFCCIAVGSEEDLRFLYCACCISHMLNDWSGIDQDKAVDYIVSCKSFDGALALLPGQEGHGGSTFVGIASLVLLQRLDSVLDDTNNNNWRSDLIHWCVSRQVAGMQGRPNKDEDTCYSYWIGATLRLVGGRDDLLHHDLLRGYVMKCQTAMGGFSKVIGAYPDVLHAYYSLSYLSLSQPHFSGDNEDDGRGIQLKKLNCTLGVSQDTASHSEPLFS